MKRLLLTVLPLLLIVGCSKPINEETLIDKDGLKYHPDTKELYSGKVFQNRMGGEKEFEGSYMDGKKDGVWTILNSDGKKKREGTYKDDNLSGEWTYYHEDGTKIEPINFRELIEKEGIDLKKDKDISYSGLVFYLNDDGKKKEQVYLKDGKMISSTEWTWYKNGQKKSESTYKDGELDGLVTEWNYNGQKESEETYKDGELVRTTIWMFYDNGQKFRLRTYKDNTQKYDGLYTDWYVNGQKKEEGTFKDGKKDGLFTEWYENGQKEYEETYKDGELDGLVTYWYENGQKSGEGTLKDGNLISKKEWNEDGSVKK